MVGYRFIGVKWPVKTNFVIFYEDGKDFTDNCLHAVSIGVAQFCFFEHYVAFRKFDTTTCFLFTPF
jgi:hypothetical protein